jgi:hypothetical protein
MHDAHILGDIHRIMRNDFDALEFSNIHNPSIYIFNKMEDKWDTMWFLKNYIKE